MIFHFYGSPSILFHDDITNMMKHFLIYHHLLVFYQLE